MIGPRKVWWMTETQNNFEKSNNSWYALAKQSKVNIFIHVKHKEAKAYISTTNNKGSLDSQGDRRVRDGGTNTGFLLLLQIMLNYLYHLSKYTLTIRRTWILYAAEQALQHVYQVTLKKKSPQKSNKIRFWLKSQCCKFYLNRSDSFHLQLLFTPATNMTYTHNGQHQPMPTLLFT